MSEPWVTRRARYPETMRPTLNMEYSIKIIPQCDIYCSGLKKKGKKRKYAVIKAENSSFSYVNNLVLLF